MAVACISAAEDRVVAALDFTGAFLYAHVPTDKENATLVKLGQFLTRILVKLDRHTINLLERMGHVS